MKLRNIFSIYNENTHKVVELLTLKFKFRKSTKPQIPFLVYWVGTKCSLKCKLCCNLIPYVKQQSYDAGKILKDLEFLSKNTEIKHLQIQGGEPFTHPKISRIIDFVGKLKISYIELATNGTIDLSQDVISAIKRTPNVHIRISNYKCTEALRKRFCNKLEENNIPYKIYSFVNDNDTWFSTGGINETKANDEVTKLTYAKCQDKGCVTLADGTITACGKIPSIKEIYNYHEKSSNDEIEVRKINSFFPIIKNSILKSKVSKFYANYDNFKEQCRYCKIAHGEFPAAEQLTETPYQAQK